MDRASVLDRFHEAADRRDAAREADDLAAWAKAAYDMAVCHFELGQFPLGRVLSEEAAGVARDAGGDAARLEPDALGLQGRCAQRMDRDGEALEHYRNAADRAGELGATRAQVEWSLKVGSLSGDPSRIAGAIDAGEAAVTRGDADPRLRPVLAAGHALLAGAGADDDAARHFERAFELLADLPLSSERFQVVLAYATHLARARRTDLAVTYVDEAREIARELGLEPMQLRKPALALAALQEDAGEYRAAGDAYARLATEDDDLETEHRLLTLAVDAYWRGSLWQPMREVCVRLNELRALGGSPYGRFDGEFMHAIACFEAGALDEALAAADRAVGHARDAGPEHANVAVAQRATIKLERGEVKGAVADLEAIEPAPEHRDVYYQELAHGLCRLGEIARARDVRQRAEGAGAGPVALAYIDVALAQAGAGDLVTAWNRLGNAGRRDPAVEYEALAGLVAAFPPGSEDRYEAARHLLRVIGNQRHRVADIFSEDDWQAVAGGWQPPAMHLDTFLDEAAATGRHDEALYELERFRNEFLMDVIAERAIRWRGPRDDRQLLKGLFGDQARRERYRLRALAQRGAGWRRRREVAEEVERLEQTARTAGGIIELDAVRHSMGFPQTWAELLHGGALHEGEWLLYLHPGSADCLAWTVGTSGEARLQRVPGVSRSVVADLVARLPRPGAGVGRALTLLAEEAVDLGEDLDELNGRFAAPLLAAIDVPAGSAVRVVAGTDLALLPLERCAAVTERRLEVSFVPSVRALMFARAERFPGAAALFYAPDPATARDQALDWLKVRRNKALVVSDPSATLRFAALEAAAVHEALAGYEVSFAGGEALDGAELARAVGGSGLFHYAGHGRFDPAAPYRSGLHLGPPADPASLWTVADVFSDVDAFGGRLAVLAGCETGRSQPSRVQEEVSLPAALLAAGFAAVVASRWVVDDVSTTLFMQRLYGTWLPGGVTIAAAVADAAGWLAGLERDEAATLVRELPGRLGDLAPDGAAAACRAQADAIDAGAARPFSSPHHATAFYVVGDGALTADGPDLREPRPPG